MKYSDFYAAIGSTKSPLAHRQKNQTNNRETSSPVIDTDVDPRL
jgi:hypothetical protein